MVARGEIDGQPSLANLTDRAVTLAVGHDEVWSWDRAGRLYSAWYDGRTRRRGLNGRILEKSRRDGALERHTLDPHAADALVSRAAARASAAAAFAGSAGEDSAELTATLARAAAFDAAHAQADRERFLALYGEVGILPPDQYLALVAHATEGCSFNSCTFCELYRTPFRVKSRDEFAQHLRDVRAYMGDSLRLRGRSVFLGAANALTLSTARLLPLLDDVAAEFTRRLPVGAFVDAFTGSHKTEDEYRALAQHGLARVYIGLESGHDPLLELVRKPGQASDAVAAARAMKAADLSVAVIVLVGLGGDRFADAHVRDTAGTVNAMQLGARDLVYFSELVEPSDGRYAAGAQAAGTRPLGPAALAAQRQAIVGQLVFTGGRPRMARYDVREFVY